jgi:ferredoxin-fold anticodon binding domain-containing protein
MKNVRNSYKKPEKILHKRTPEKYEKEAVELLSATRLRTYMDGELWREIQEISTLLEKAVIAHKKSVNQIVSDTKKLMKVRENLYVSQAIGFLYTDFFYVLKL